MIDLMNITRQANNMGSELDAAVLEVLHSGQYIMGEKVSNFEKKFAEYCGVKYAIAVGNGTDALVIALEAIGVGAGDEVITSAMSFFATAEAISRVGATPVFVDCTNDTYVIDATKIEEKITSKTKAILPVHLYGQCADMDEINRIAKAHNLYVVEDCAQAAGARYKGMRAGSLGDVACFSFFPTKNLGCAGDGGIVLTSSEDIFRKSCAYRVHGSGEHGAYVYMKENSGLEGVKIDFGENLPKYFNFVIGHNSRLDAIQAAVLGVKLPHLEEWNESRRKVAQRYNTCIVNGKVKKPFMADYNEGIYYVYILQVKERDDFRKYMKEKGISTGVYFPIPLHLQMVYKKLGYKKGDMPNAEYLAEHGVAIPMFAELTEEELNVVIEAINNY